MLNSEVEGIYHFYWLYRTSTVAQRYSNYPLHFTLCLRALETLVVVVHCQCDAKIFHLSWFYAVEGSNESILHNSPLSVLTNQR